jgi:hypothetical protein
VWRTSSWKSSIESLIWPTFLALRGAGAAALEHAARFRHDFDVAGYNGHFSAGVPFFTRPTPARVLIRGSVP